MTDHAPPHPLGTAATGAGALVGKIGEHKEVRSCPDNELSKVKFRVFHSFDPSKLCKLSPHRYKGDSQGSD